MIQTIKSLAIVIEVVSMVEGGGVYESRVEIPIPESLLPRDIITQALHAAVPATPLHQSDPVPDVNL